MSPAFPSSAEKIGLRAKLRRLVVEEAGGESALERECFFAMARGENGCRLVQNKGL